jgi:uncharacterized protein (TIGR03067 family)
MKVTALIAALAAIYFMPVPDDAADKDQAKLEGTWKLVAMEVDGKDVPAEKLTSATLTIKGNKYSVLSGKKLHEVELKLDASKTPKEIDMQFLDGPNKDRVGRGIYRIDGDKFKICRALDPQDERPKDFKTKGQVNYFVLVWERQP